jgi:hypothetical protein
MFRKGRLGELGVDFKIILKLNFKKNGLNVGWIHVVQDIIQ